MNTLKRLSQHAQPGSSWASLARIGAWTLVWFVVLGISAPFVGRQLTDSAYNNVAGMRSNPAVQVVSPNRNDISGFTSTYTTDDQFKIAWIAGSSVQSIGPHHYTFVPAETQLLMPTVDGRETVVDVYFLSGIRITDIYFAALEALEDEPDLLVIAWNPLWVLNNTANHDWSELDAEIVRTTFREPSAIPLVAGYLAPGDIALATASAVSDAVRYRLQTSTSINERVLGFSPFVREFEIEPEAEPPSELARIREMQIPVSFWRNYRNVPVPGQTLADRQAQFILDSVLDKRTVNADVIRRIGELTTDRRIPVYTYMAPIDHKAIAEPVIDSALAGIESEVASYASFYNEPFHSFNTTSLSRLVPPFRFKDIVHIAEAGPVANHLVNDICAHLASLNQTCEQPPLATRQSASFPDFDGDGASDVLGLLLDGVVRYAPGAQSLWTEGVAYAQDDVILGDFDADRATDLLRISEDNHYEYSPSASQPWQQLQPATTQLADLRLGDFNADGTTDLLELRPSVAEPEKHDWMMSIGGIGEWQYRAGSTAQPDWLIASASPGD